QRDKAAPGALLTEVRLLGLPEDCLRCIWVCGRVPRTRPHESTMPLTPPSTPAQNETGFSFLPRGFEMATATQPPTLAGPSIETLEALLDVTYAWGYQETRAKLRDLYDKAVRAQWISDDVLPWNTDVDLERPLGPDELMPL